MLFFKKSLSLSKTISKQKNGIQNVRFKNLKTSYGLQKYKKKY